MIQKNCCRLLYRLHQKETKIMRMSNKIFIQKNINLKVNLQKPNSISNLFERPIMTI